MSAMFVSATSQRSSPERCSNRVALIALVGLMLTSVVAGGCIGTSRFEGAEADALVAPARSSAATARLQGTWRGQADIGNDSIPEAIEFYRSTTSVLVADQRSSVAVFDVLASSEDWIQILVKHPSHVAVTTVRFVDRDRFWMEHYPDTIYTRDGLSQSPPPTPTNPRDR